MRTGRETDSTKLIVAYRDLANTPKNYWKNKGKREHDYETNTAKTGPSVVQEITAATLILFYQT
jgi:hypothetical protein